jgi:DMSO/TMAO reductase YedYZ heme-binding membrane subunit
MSLGCCPDTIDLAADMALVSLTVALALFFLSLGFFLFVFYFVARPNAEPTKAALIWLMVMLALSLALFVYVVRNNILLALRRPLALRCQFCFLTDPSGFTACLLQCRMSSCHPLFPDHDFRDSIKRGLTRLLCMWQCGRLCGHGIYDSGTTA